jgi:methionyl-tRNA synthetase
VSRPTFFLTTAIDYVNSTPHLGTAYEKVCADVIARYKRLAGFDTHFLMGNDEHSQNVYKTAVDQGLDPLEYCNRMEEAFTRTWRHLDVSYDDFIRTTQTRHRAGVTEIAQRIFDAGDIYEGTYEGWYCVGCEAFKQEKDLVDGRCPLHPTTPLQWINEKNYFFRLSKYQQPLLDHFHANPQFLQPDIRRNEILRLLESGLEDISVSRAGQSWGIPLPFDQGSVVYVWFDALINYASAVGLGTDPAMFSKWWPADLHVIGKDITRFHTVIWPAMLMSAGVPLPRAVFGHGFMTMDGQRMSKSLGTIVDPIVAADRHGVDALRLYLVKEIPFGGDGDFSWSRFDERYNVDLANNLGNLVSRVTAMAARYRSGRVEAGAGGKLAALAAEQVAAYRRAMDSFAIHDGAAAAFRLIDGTNEFIAETAPWQLARDGSQAQRLSDVLFEAAEAIRVAAVLLLPIMPGSAAEILRRMGVPDGDVDFERDTAWSTGGTRELLQKGALWPRFEKETTVEQATTPGQASQPAPSSGAPNDAVPGAAPHPAPAPADASAAPASAPAGTGPAAAAPAGGDLISYDEFMKIDLRVAKIVQAERVPKSKKLLKLLVDTGVDQRTIVAGIAEAYEPEALVGRTIAIVFNLKPAKLMGIESNGMVLAGSTEGGKPHLVTFDEALPPGSRVR